MTDRPIIFSAPMVRALLDGRKTQTRRIYKVPAGSYVEQGRVWAMTDGCQHGDAALPYAAGDRLWVREAWASDGMVGVRYYATDDVHELRRKRSPIHMPRLASRLTLIVTDVRVQRLHEISEADAWAEGCRPGTLDDRGDPFPAEEPHPKCGWVGWDCARDWYADLWDSIHGPDAWDSNPWVAAISFDVRQGNINTLNQAKEKAE